MKLELKYGLNPNQKPSYVEIPDGYLRVLNGKPGYINLLDALNGYSLVCELENALGIPAATSFKHVSPAGAAIGLPLSENEKRAFFIGRKEELSPLACAYIRARGADRMSSFGDFIALSSKCDSQTAKIIKREVSDGVIAPCYDDEALDILKSKKNGAYTILEINDSVSINNEEFRRVRGIEFTEPENNLFINADTFSNIVTGHSFPKGAIIDLTVATIALKYTQSNSVIYAYNGQTIGIGAGQQSRLHCTRLAGDKADKWTLRQSERVLSLPFREKLSRNDKDNIIEQYLSDDGEEDVIGSWEKYFSQPVEPFTRKEKKDYIEKQRGRSLSSDAFFPFSDNITRAFRSGVDYIAEPGGSLRDEDVISKCKELGIVLALTGSRLFHH